MSILIKGMEMPIKCAKCPIADISAEYYFCEKIDWFGKERPFDCPLTELPQHGDLVDRDKLMTDLMDSDLDHLQRDDWKEVIQIVEDAPTIIEAEGRKI